MEDIELDDRERTGRPDEGTMAGRPEDIERIKLIYDRQADLVYRTALVFMRNSNDAEDIVQSVFLTLIEKNLKFTNADHERAWCITAARNRCKDVLKSMWRRGVDFWEDPADFEDRQNSLADSRQDLQDESLQTALLKLPDDQREMLFLHYYEGYTVRETADIMGLKESTVRSGLTSARNKLRRIHNER